MVAALESQRRREAVKSLNALLREYRSRFYGRSEYLVEMLIDEVVPGRRGDDRSPFDGMSEDDLLDVTAALQIALVAVRVSLPVSYTEVLEATRLAIPFLQTVRDMRKRLVQSDL